MAETRFSTPAEAENWKKDRFIAMVKFHHNAVREAECADGTHMLGLGDPPAPPYGIVTARVILGGGGGPAAAGDGHPEMLATVRVRTDIAVPYNNLTAPPFFEVAESSEHLPHWTTLSKTVSSAAEGETALFWVLNLLVFAELNAAERLVMMISAA